MSKADTKKGETKAYFHFSFMILSSFYEVDWW